VALSATASAGPAEVRRWHAMAAALTAQAARNGERAVQPAIPSGWRNVPTAPQKASYDGEVEVGYRLGRDGFAVTVGDEPIEDLQVWALTPSLLDATVAGLRRRVEVNWVGDVSYVDSDLGSSTLVEVDRFPVPRSAAAQGSLLAPMPGSVVRVHAVTGAAVHAGDTLVVLEAMKMEHSIRAPHDGVVGSVAVRVGQQVETGAMLVVVEEQTEGETT
jgi:propionyl-CoA carboxylase alpha chain